MYVSKITKFYCQPDMRSLSALCQGVHTHFHDGFWRSDHYFLIASHSNFLSAMQGFRDNEFFANSIWRYHDFSARGHFTLFHMTDSERATMTSWWRSILTFYLGCMVSEIMRFYCQPDMTSSLFRRQGALNVNFWLPILKGRPRFYISVELYRWYIDSAVLLKLTC